MYMLHVTVNVTNKAVNNFTEYRPISRDGASASGQRGKGVLEVFLSTPLHVISVNSNRSRAEIETPLENSTQKRSTITPVSTTLRKKAVEKHPETTLGI